MSKKKNGVLQFTAEDCRQKNEQQKKRCDYTKIAKTIGEINAHIKEDLSYGQAEVKIGRIYEGNVFPILIYAYDYEECDGHLTDSEWRIVEQQLKDAGFTVNIDERNDNITLSW